MHQGISCITECSALFQPLIEIHEKLIFILVVVV